ncbi:MAG: hypothetical protein IT257_05435 [Chitinophagaceae bacterium]|nr:hypothetical protein [Chitinophagaceae bacterium]
MKKILLSLCAISFFAQLTFVACKKESKIAAVTEQSNQTPSAYLFEVLPCSVNPNNPFDHYGQGHNEGLSAIAASPDFANISQEQSHQIAFESAFNGNPDPVLTYANMLPCYQFIENTLSPIAAIGNMAYNQNEISLAAKNRLVELNELIYNSPDEEQFDNQLVNFENNVIAEGGFTPNELEMILGTSAVARYSKCYWMNAVENDDNPWHHDVMLLGSDLPNQYRGKFKNWWNKMTKKEKNNVVAADASGFLIGAMTGFIGGNMFGGPVVGAIAGGALGVGTAVVVSRRVAKGTVEP